MATPDSGTCLMISKFFSTRIGARPIDGSSIPRSFGRAIGARPTAPTCRPPPDNAPTTRAHPLLAPRQRARELGATLVEQREERVDAIEVLLRAAAAEVGTHLEV